MSLQYVYQMGHGLQVGPLAKQDRAAKMIFLASEMIKEAKAARSH